MSYASDRQYRQIVFLITLVAFPIALVIFASSGCDLRKRSEKQACRNGEVQHCLEVGKYYEDRDDGIIGFLMSNADTAITNYYQACRLKSPVGCERMLYLRTHSDQAKNQSTEDADVADALIDGCIARVAGSCDGLWTFMKGSDWVAIRSAAAFERRCTAGDGEACYRFGRMHGQNLGGQRNTLEEVLPIYDRGCASGSSDACQSAQNYRVEQAKRVAHDVSAVPGSAAATPEHPGSDSLKR
jgi:TPR repeat protein